MSTQTETPAPPKYRIKPRCFGCGTSDNIKQGGHGLPEDICEQCYSTIYQGALIALQE